MIENFTDRLAVVFGGSAGVVFANIGIVEDIVVKFVCTIVFAAVGAVISFFIKRCLDRCYYHKKERKTKK